MLIREHRGAYKALCARLSAGAGVGDCIAAIEDNLPATLPAVERKEQREMGKKKREQKRFTSYIAAMTQKVGGIGSSDSVASAEAIKTTAGDVSSDENKDEAIAEFTRKIRTLERAVQLGDINVPSNRGGVWLNGGTSPGVGLDVRGEDTPSPTLGSNNNITSVSALSPLELLRSHRGYRVKQLENDDKYYAAKVRSYFAFSALESKV